MKEILVEQCPTNPHYKIYYTRHRLMPMDECFYSESFSKSWEDVHPLGMTKTIFEKAEQIMGVETVWVEKYEFSLVKAPSFSWEEIEEEFYKLLITYLPPVNNYSKYNK